MEITNASFTIESKVDGDEILQDLEKIGRVCYKSEEKIAIESAGQFIAKIIKSGHESVIEHKSISVRVICDRGVSHEIVRHRIASYSQESTRYCNYSKNKFGSEISVINPCFWDKADKSTAEKYVVWEETMRLIEEAYMRLLSLGASPQEARSVLPNSLKTEIVMTMNLREWRHFFRLRTSVAAHPQMREFCLPLLKEFQRLIPVIFDDISE